MCIEFVCVREDAGPDDIALIVANNRDEVYERPTTPAGPWPTDPRVLSALDQEAGRQGGTWLAVNTHSGRMGTLLNISQPGGPDPSRQGRGRIVAGYVSGGLTARQYLARVEAEASRYNGCNILLLERQGSSWTPWYYNNVDGSPPRQLAGPYIGLGNSVLDQPYLKVERGLLRFQAICEQYTQPNEELRREVQALMESRAAYWPDPTLDRSSAAPEATRRGLSSVYVDLSDHGYGTRSTSILVVTGGGAGEYWENNREGEYWVGRSHSFQLSPSAQRPSSKSGLGQNI